MTTELIPTHIPVPGKPLGRHINHDPRSLAFPFRAPTLTLTSARHSAPADPILDQGDLGSCTGNAEVGALACSLGILFAALTPEQRAHLTETLAVALYTRATQLDPFKGQMPDQDTGSDGNSVAKAGVEKDLVGSWSHALSTDDALKAMGTAPGIFGQNWYSGADNPTDTGQIKVTGRVRGGHETCIDEVDVDLERVWIRQSWGDWGIDGRAWYSFADFDRLMGEDGDYTVLAPRKVTPGPIPVPDADKVFADATRDWSLARHRGDNHAAAVARQVWGRERNLD